MSNSKELALDWVRGLGLYLEYKKDPEAQKFINFLEKSMYADNPVIDIVNQSGMIEFISVLRKFTPNPVFDIFHKYYRWKFDPASLCDAFSKGQVQSKIWLIEELEKIKKDDLGNVLILAGWFGQFISYIDNFKFNQARIIEIDKPACIVSDRIFNIDHIEGHKVKSVLADINSLELSKNGYNLDVKKYHSDEDIGYTQQFLPDVIVNTSSEHMSEDWFFQLKFKKLKSNPLVIIQSNNLFDIEEHINCVHSVEHMKKKYPFEEILYEGEIELYGYKRFMLIGRP